MRQRETIRRRAFMDGFRAGLRHRDRAVRELIDSELKQFETRCNSEEKRFGEALAAATRAALHRLQGPEAASVEQRWLQ